MSEENERTVTLSGVPKAQAPGVLHAAGRMTDEQAEQAVGEVVNAVVQYTQKEYTSFKAEHGLKDGDLVIHFFLPLEDPKVLGKADARIQKSWNAFWLEKFPAVLSPVAQEYFQADLPRIVAKYTPEVASWWFLARGFGSMMDPQAFAEAFLAKLDAALVDVLPPPLVGS